MADCFPMRSTEFPVGTSRYNDYITAINKVGMARSKDCLQNSAFISDYFLDKYTFPPNSYKSFKCINLFTCSHYNIYQTFRSTYLIVGLPP